MSIRFPLFNQLDREYDLKLYRERYAQQQAEEAAKCWRREFTTRLWKLYGDKLVKPEPR